MRHKWHVVLFCFVVLLAGVALWRPWHEKVVPGNAGTPTAVDKEPASTAQTQASVEAGAEQNTPAAKAGTESAQSTNLAKKKQAAADNPAPDLGFGRVQPVSGNASVQAASVLEALKTGQHPERLSVLHPPEKPFDKAAFEADPDKYLNTIEPGRVFQTLQPGKDVPALVVVGSGYYRVIQGSAVKLAVKGAPRAPVTFVSTDLGAFVESKLSSVTVRADEQGVATVNFVATPGTLNDVNIMAGSPLASGQVRLKVDVERGKPANN